MRHLTGDYWQLSSEVMNYPDLTKFTNLSIETSISKNRTYLKSNCVRLSVADSHWLYQQANLGVLPVGTRVIINP